MKREVTQKDGITLIALVITIIVLIILAGVSINLVLGENGIITKSKESSKDYKVGKTLEKLELEKSNLYTEKEGAIPTVGEYVQHLIEKEIITTVDVINIEDEIKHIIVDGFIFLVEKEENGNIKITYQGEADGKPRIAIIKVVEIESNSITVKVLASQVNGGTFSYEIKNITEEETEYTAKANKITENQYKFDNLVIGNEYRIQVTLENSKGSDTKETSKTIKTKVIEVENIIMDQEEISLKEGESTTLVATILPDNATNKDITWTSSDEEAATVDSNGTVTAKAVGSTTITASSNDDSSKKATCYVTVTGEQSDWKLLSKIAKAIAQDEQIDYTDTEVTVTVDGREHTIEVGQIYQLKYKGQVKDVRVLGFKHDELVDKMSYGFEADYAGISFEFISGISVHDSRFLIGHPELGNFWPGSSNRAVGNTLVQNGTTFSNYSYIKQVRKPYVGANKNQTAGWTEDYLWFLSVSEIYGKWYGIYAGLEDSNNLPDGKQYAFYQSRVENSSLSQANPRLGKACTNDRSADLHWWTRSPNSNRYNDNVIYVISQNGSLLQAMVGATHRKNEIPGFAI